MELEAILTTIEVCYTVGSLIVEKCQNWRNAEEEVDERIKKVELIWSQTRLQADLLLRIANILDDEYRRNLDAAIGNLVKKLSSANHALHRVLEDGKGHTKKRTGFHGFGLRVRRGKYAFLKDTLDEVIKDLEDSHKWFDPTWFLVMRMANPVIDQQLLEVRSASAEGCNPTEPSPPYGLAARKAKTRHLDLAQGLRNAIHSSSPPKSIMLAYDPMEHIPIPYCTAVATKRWSRTLGGYQWFIIDRLSRQPESSKEDLVNDVRSLAKRLAQSDPYTFGLLNCKGAMPVPDDSQSGSSHDLVLRVPDGLTSRTSLRQMLLSPETRASLSLTLRLRIAQQLASSVSYVHNFNFVHKGICPESILLLAESPESLIRSQAVHTFLVGFGNFRAVNASTALVGETAWEKNIYRHPERQGECLQDPYRMQHDVYSLGVCLLEIGLWESFVEYTHGNQPQNPNDSQSYQHFRTWTEARSHIEQNAEINGSQIAVAHRLSYLLREYLIHLSETRLPHSMGDLYRDVVVACLSSGGGGADDEAHSSEQELDQEAEEDKGGISVGVHFIEEILGKLAEITL